MTVTGVVVGGPVVGEEENLEKSAAVTSESGGAPEMRVASATVPNTMSSTTHVAGNAAARGMASRVDLLQRPAPRVHRCWGAVRPRGATISNFSSDGTPEHTRLALNTHPLREWYEPTYTPGSRGRVPGPALGQHAWERWRGAAPPHRSDWQRCACASSARDRRSARAGRSAGANSDPHEHL